METFGNFIGAVGLVLTFMSGVAVINAAVKDQRHLPNLAWATAGFMLIVVTGVVVAGMPT